VPAPRRYRSNGGALFGTAAREDRTDVVTPLRRGENQSGRERPDDRCQTEQVRDSRERHCEDDGVDDQCAPHLHPSDPAHQRGSQPNSGHDRHDQEDDRLSREQANGGKGHISGLRDSRHDRQDDKAEDVVHDRRSEHYLGGGILKTTEVTKHARRDTDAGRRQCGPDEDGQERGGAERVHDSIADSEWHRYADERNERRLKTRPQQVVEITLQANLEQEEQHAELGQGVKH
jgi:hypothetical protein